MKRISAMRAIFSLAFDLIFPPSKEALLVRRATREDVLALYEPRILHDATTLTHYRTPLMTALVHEAKFHANKKAINLLGALLSHHSTKVWPNGAHVVPLPLSSTRARERGYNQIEEIAESACAQGASLEIHHLLMKVRHTAPQSSLSRSERLTNLQGAFAATADIPRDTPLVLLDDITTTGATLDEAVRALTRAGFTHIEKLALAH
jgi:ComF family protein